MPLQREKTSANYSRKHLSKPQHLVMTTMAANSIKLLTGNSHPELAKRVSER